MFTLDYKLEKPNINLELIRKWKENFIFLKDSLENPIVFLSNKFNLFISNIYDDLSITEIKKLHKTYIKLKINWSDGENFADIYVFFDKKINKQVENIVYLLVSNIEKDLELLLKEEELKDKKEKEIDFFENMSNALIVFDENNNIIFANKEAEKLTNYSREELFSKKFDKIFFIDKDENVSFDLECKIITKDKKEKKIIKNTSYVKNKNGNINSKIEIFKELNNNDTSIYEIQKLYTAIEQSYECIVITDLDGNIEYVNNSFEVITGYKKEEVIGKNPKVLNSNYHNKQFYISLWETIKNGKNWNGEFYNRKKDGSYYWEKAVITPVKDLNGQIKNYIAIKEDITELKKYSEKLKLSIAEFEIIFSNSLIGFIYLNKDNLIERVNKKFEDITNYKQAELKGKDTKFFHINEENYKKFQKYYLELDKNNEIKLEYPYLTKDKKEIWVKMYGKKIEDNKGYLWSFEDISEHKKLENFKKDIERIVKHDLKTPINAIIGFPSLMLEDTNLSSEQKENLEFIIQSGKIMLRQIDSTLNLYKIETGNFKSYLSKINIIKLIKDVEKTLFNLINLKKLKINLFFNDKLYTNDFEYLFNTDEVLFFTIYSNILKNAIEASSDTNEIDIRVNTKNDNLIIEIKNNGEIPISIRDKVFEKYVSYNKNNGTGLGIYSAKLMIETLEGSINFKSENGFTVFSLIFKRLIVQKNISDIYPG